MKKIIIICVSLTFCCLALLRISYFRTDENRLTLQTEEYKLTLQEEFSLDIPNGSALPVAEPTYTVVDAMLSTSPTNINNNEEYEEAQQTDISSLPLTLDYNNIEEKYAEPPQPKTQHLLALTFDDGPSKEFTPLLLDGLKERAVHVTFFMLGSRAEKAPDIVLRAYEEGHAIGGHSYDHRGYFTKISATALNTQIQKTDDIITGIIGNDPPFLLRPPYGAINEAVAEKTGKAIVLWNVDPRDWESRDAAKVYSAIMEKVKDGGVVILHDIYGTTVEGVLKAIDTLLEEGWQFMTVPQIYEHYNITLQAGNIYRSPLTNTE